MKEGERREIVVHKFAPVFDENSRVLLLGTMPSPKSREQGFYYGHPRNRFWKVLSDLCEEAEPATTEEKRAFALRQKIAVWDVLASCEIHGADDATIRNPVANDISYVLGNSRIRAIFTTGLKAASLYRKYCLPSTGMEAESLPSTSPANCRMTYGELRAAYSKILPFLD